MSCCSHATTHETNDPLAVILIVYVDKEDVYKALDPYVDAGVRSFLVYNIDYEDGPDDTLQRVKEFFDQHHIDNYHLMQEPYDVASTICNHALDVAEAKFPQTTFLLKHDRVNQHLHNVADLLQFCKEEQQSEHPCYDMVQVVNDYNFGEQWSFWRSGLIRARTGTRYQGGEYEYISLDTRQKVPADIFFTEHVPFEEGLQAYRENRKNKKIAWLLAAYEKDPKNIWAVLSLAFTYKEYDNIERSEYYYRLYEQMHSQDRSLQA